MRWPLILLFIAGCQIQTIQEPQPDTFWCLDRWSECFGDYCPFNSYFQVGHNQCFEDGATCAEERDDFLQAHYERQGVDGWRYDARCYPGYHAYCFQGPVPGDLEFCWSSHYNCEVERPRDREFSECYRRNKS